MQNENEKAIEIFNALFPIGAKVKMGENIYVVREIAEIVNDKMFFTTDNNQKVSVNKVIGQSRFFHFFFKIIIGGGLLQNEITVDYSLPHHSSDGTFPSKKELRKLIEKSLEGSKAKMRSFIVANWNEFKDVYDFLDYKEE